MYSLGEGQEFIGLHNRLWRLESYENQYYKTRPNWFHTCTTERLIVKLEWYNFWYEKPNEHRQLCKIYDGDERDESVVCIGWLYDKTHLLIRLQRWARRRLRVARVRQVLLMALHPRLGSESLLSTLGVDLLFQDILGYVGAIA